MFEFLTGCPPFNDETPEAIFQNILSGSTLLALFYLKLKLILHFADVPWVELPPETSPEAKDLLKRLLCEDPNERIGTKCKFFVLFYISDKLICFFLNNEKR